MKIFLTVVFTIIGLIVIALAFVYLGFYNVAAINPPGKIESWFFSTVTDNSVLHHSADIKAPALEAAATADSGFQQFSKMCVGCHGAPGVKDEGMSKALNPSPPNLADAVGDESDAAIFWIVKNGIKMTGMPAFSAFKSDNEIWQIVAFVRLLPKMTPEQYQAYKNRLEQSGAE